MNAIEKFCAVGAGVLVPLVILGSVWFVGQVRAWAERGFSVFGQVAGL